MTKQFTSPQFSSYSYQFLQPQYSTNYNLQTQIHEPPHHHLVKVPTMVPPPSVTLKPSRSDEIIDPNQQIQIAQQVKAHFDSILPKRPQKPNRSDPENFTSELHSDESVDTIPELIKLQSLISQSQGIVSDGGATVDEEFVETGYYKELVSIDKQHHTTGNGFIKVATKEESDNHGYDLRFPIRSDGGYRSQGFKSNPATNDWVPSSVDYFDQDEYVSSKPNRSENM